jgi:hypothetical protein
MWFSTPGHRFVRLSASAHSRRASARANRPLSYRPRLEPLEERTLLSKTTTWTGANSLIDTNWSDGQNWSDGVPETGDTAVFNTDNASSQFSTVDRSYTLASLQIQPTAGGIMFIHAPLVVTGSSEWDAIMLDINGPQGGSVTNNGIMTLTNGVEISDNGTFTNNGTLIEQGTTGDLGVGGFTNGQGLSVKLDNTAAGVIDLQSDVGITSGNGYITNEGTIKKTGGTGTSYVNVSIKTTGTIDAESGTIQFVGVDSSDTGTSFGAVSTNGTFKTAAGAVIELARSGELPFVANGTFTATGSGKIALDAGVLNIGSSGATFKIASTVTFAWSDANMDISAGATLTYDGALSIDTTDSPALNGSGDFVENGTITLSGPGNWNIGYGDGVTRSLVISAGSTLNLQSDCSLYALAVSYGSTSSAQIINAGTIIKTGGTGTSTLEPSLFTSIGILGAWSGSLNVNVAGEGFTTFTNAGTLAIAPGSTIVIPNNYTQTGTGVLDLLLASATSFGKLQVTGTATLGGTLTVATANHYAPSTSDSFPVLTAGTVTGAFPTTTGMTFANGVFLNPVYSATQVVLNGTPQPISISGTVFLDINCNGVQNPGEPGLSGQTLLPHLNGTNGGITVAALTDANGHFQCTVRLPGTYTLSQLGSGGLLFAEPAGGSYQVTVTSGQNVTGFNFADVPTSILVPLTLPLQTPFPKQGQGNADYVEALYRAILNRNADPAGLAAWTSLLNSGALSRLQVVQGIRQSVEHFTQEVTAYYVNFLIRQPDPAGLQGWVQQLQNGMPEEQMVFNFLDSAEYIGKGDWYFINQMYFALLGRSADPAGRTAWLSALGDDANGNHVGPATVTHEQVITTFLHSPECLTRLVQGYYLIYLQRLPDPAGLNAWLTVLEQGGSFLAIGESILASDEFFNRAAAHG